MANETLLKFNYPESLICEYQNWVVLLRPKQVTAGSLILACKLDATKMSEVPAEAFAELSRVTTDLEGVLSGLFAYEKINYLLLMMADKHVHFHVLPRYSGTREVCGVTFSDTSLPKPPDLSKVTDITTAQYKDILETIKRIWPS